MIPLQITAPRGVGDERDYFPFAQIDFDDPHLTPTFFTYLEYFELVWRRRAFTANWTTNVGSGSEDFSNYKYGTFPGYEAPLSEEDIFPRMRQGFPDVDKIATEATIGGGTINFTPFFQHNNYRWNLDSFTPAMIFTFSGVASSSIIPSDPGYTTAGVTVSFLGKSIPMGGSTTLITGSLDIVASASDAFWGWDGHFDTTTGAPI